VIFAGGGLIDEGYVRAVEQILGIFHERKAACVSLGKHLFPSVSVIVDNIQVIQDAMQYLVNLGHTRIAYISGPSLLTTADLRLKGYKMALEKHGLQQNPTLILNGDYTYEAGLHAGKTIAALTINPTAVLASNDLMAIGCLVGLKELGYKIPEDISVMGIDDIGCAQFVDPPLTTISLPLYDLGKVGMESLIKLRFGEIKITDTITLPHHLVERKSTVPPRMKR